MCDFPGQIALELSKHVQGDEKLVTMLTLILDWSDKVTQTVAVEDLPKDAEKLKYMPILKTPLSVISPAKVVPVLY